MESSPQLSDHARRRMRQRGITREQVEETIRNARPFRYFHAGEWKIGYYNSSGGIFVSQVKDTIVTVMAQVKAQYVERLRKGAP